MRRWLVALVVLLLIGLGIAALLLLNSPATSSVQVAACSQDAAGDCLRLPSVSGDNLDGTRLSFPADFAGALNLVVMPFDREQQTAAIAWLPLFQRLAAQRPDAAYYSIAALEDLSAPIRALVVGGLNLGISDPATRQATVVLFLQDQAAFVQALGLADMAVGRVFIFAQDGTVRYQDSAAYDEARAAALEAAWAALP